MRLLALERDLLNAINNVGDSILEDNEVLQKLEQLQSEATDVAAKSD